MSLNAVSNQAYAGRGQSPAEFASLAPQPPQADGGHDTKTREAFQDFVGQTFYGQMLKAMRKTVGKAAYFNGGQTEEIFQQQLDQVLAEKLSDATAEQFSGPMFELFCANRRL